MEPLWIDANTLMRIAEGDSALEAEILVFRAQGRPILVVPKALEEARVGNPFRANRPAPNMDPVTVQAVNGAFIRIRAVLDTQGNSEDRATAYQAGGLQRNRQGQLPSVRHESDNVLLSQIAASARARGITNPTLFSLDAALRTTLAPRFGITGIPRVSTPPVTLRATTGDPSGPVQPGGPSAQGQALGSFVQGAHAIIKSGLTKYSQQKAGEDELAAYDKQKDTIRDMVMNNPGMGARVDFYFVFQPGVNRDFPDTYTFMDMTVAVHPGPRQQIVFETIPRGELQTETIIIPANPAAKRPPQKEITADSVKSDLARLWNVTIGTWKGIFEFKSDGTMYWAEKPNTQHHPGRWWVTAEKIEFKFNDDPPGNVRHWRITSGLYLKEVKGCVLPEGVNGFFQMTRAEWYNVNGG